MKKCFEFPNKRKYASQKDAEVAILLSDSSKELNTYYCSTCNGWHLTSRKK